MKGTVLSSFVRSLTRCALLTPASGIAHIPEVQYTPADMCLFCHVTATATAITTFKFLVPCIVIQCE